MTELETYAQEDDIELTRWSTEELHGWRHLVGLKRLPRDIRQINEFQKFVRQQIEPARELRPTIQALREAIESDAFTRMYLSKMLGEVPRPFRHFDTIDQMLQAINYVIGIAPIYKDVDSISWQFPLSSLMNFWMVTPSGRTVLRTPLLNRHLNRIMRAWCEYLDSEDSLSVLTAEPEGWLNKKAQQYNDLDSYVIPDRNAPHWGFKSYNEFFHRDIKPECRPIDAPDDPSKIASPNDGVCWALERNVKAEDEFWLKGQPYSLRNMLNNNLEMTKMFVGGDVYQTYVNGGADWHRFTSPIAGKVLGAEIVEGYAWTESDTIRYDPMSGPYSQGWAAGIATRALIYIDSGIPSLGVVCVIPIGLTEVSSLECFVKEGDTVKKGDQLGWFSFGGSSFALVFKKGAILDYLVLPPKHGRNHQNERTLTANATFAHAKV